MSAEKITKEKIIYAVLDCSFVHGVGATSLADIAGKLGIKKASLYNHYDSRDAMIKDTVQFCADSLRKLSLLPADMKAAAQKYSAEVVLKGLVRRWLKIFEKEPLIQIYSFIESEKYFSTEVSSIKSEITRKMTEQIESAVECLMLEKKIAPATKENVSLTAELFQKILTETLDSHIFEKKKFIRENPATGEGELFTDFQPEKPNFEKIDSQIEHFCGLLAQ